MSITGSFKKLSSSISIPIEKYKLKNGLCVLLNPDTKALMNSYMLAVKVGSRHERPGITGISHMFEHLMFKGTKKYPHFDKLCSEQGVIAVNAFTSYDYTAYHASFPPEKLEQILDLESDRMSHLIFEKNKLNKERKAVLEERLMVVDNSPSGLAFEHLFALIFTKHSYKQPIIGYKKDILAYDLKKLEKWYKNYYSPNNCILVLSGQFATHKAKKLIQKYFGSLKAKTLPKELKIKEPEQKKARGSSIKRDLKTALVKMAYTGPPEGTETYALEAISHILSSGESSLLYKKLVREKKWIPNIYSTLWSFKDYSVFLISYPLIDLSKEKKIKQLVLKSLKQASSKELIEKNLKKIKNIQTTQHVFSLKKHDQRASLLTDYEVRMGDYRKMYNKLEKINSLSLKFIQKTAEKYLKPFRGSYVILKPN